MDHSKIVNDINSITKSKLPDLLNSINEFISIKDPNGIYLDCNSQFELLCSKSKNDIIGKTDYYIFDRATAEKFRKSDLYVLENEQFARSEEEIFFSDGKKILCETYKYPFIEGKKLSGIIVISRDISERQKKIQNYIEIFEKLDNGIIITENDNIKYLNKKTESILGYPESQLNGMNIFQLVAANEIDKFNEHIRKMTKTNSEELFHTRLRHISGKDEFFEVKAFPLHEENVDAYLITNSEELFIKYDKQIGFLESEKPIIRFLKSTDMIQLNNRSTQLFGNFANLKQLLNFNNFDELIQKFAKSNKEFSIKGSFYSFELKKIPSVDLYYLVGKDITKEVQDRRKINLQDNIITTASDGILITDKRGKILWCNPAFEKLTGFSAREAINWSIIDLYSKKVSEETYNKLWIKIKSGQSWNGKIKSRRSDGSYYNQALILKPIKNRNGDLTHFITVMRDITEEEKYKERLVQNKETLENLVKERTRELETAKLKAESSDKLKSEFLAQISHEIRTPVNSIFTHSSLLEMYVEEDVDEQLKHSFNMIKTGGERLVRTVDLILNMSDLKLGNYKPDFKKVNIIDEILNPLLEEYKPKAGDLFLNLTNETEGKPVLKIDKYSVWHIFSNLIDNAIKYTKAGGLEILVFINDHKKLEIDFMDTGIGISEEFIPKIFEPFSQEQSGYTRKFEGNGLGLSLVNEYCKLNKIELKIESQKDVGSNFKIIF